MSIELEPKEVLEHLHSLGYCNITPDQLKDFIKDLKKLIRHDQKRAEARYFQTEEKLNSYRSQQREEVPCTCSKSSKSVKHADMALDPVGDQYSAGTQSILRRPASQNDRCESELDSSECSETQDPKVPRVQGTTRKENIPPRPPSSFIRPASRSRPKNDPVALYHYYQNIWSQNPQPGDDPRSQLRWSVRHQMMGEQRQGQSCGCPCCVKHLECKFTSKIPFTMEQDKEESILTNGETSESRPILERKSAGGERQSNENNQEESCQCLSDDVAPLTRPPDSLNTQGLLDPGHPSESPLTTPTHRPDSPRLRLDKASRKSFPVKRPRTATKTRNVKPKICVRLNVDKAKVAEDRNRKCEESPVCSGSFTSKCPLCPKCGKKKELEELARAEAESLIAKQLASDAEESLVNVKCPGSENIVKNIKVVTEINLG